MPDMIAFSPATWIFSFGNSAGSAPSRTVGTKPLKFNGTLHLRGERRRARKSPRKSRGSVTYRQLRCNMTKRPLGVGVFADRQPLRERPAPVLHKLSLLSACRTPPTCH